jgi:hypothetical protein
MMPMTACSVLCISSLHLFSWEVLDPTAAGPPAAMVSATATSTPLIPDQQGQKRISPAQCGLTALTKAAKKHSAYL